MRSLFHFLRDRRTAKLYKRIEEAVIRHDWPQALSLSDNPDILPSIHNRVREMADASAAFTTAAND